MVSHQVTTRSKQQKIKTQFKCQFSHVTLALGFAIAVVYFALYQRMQTIAHGLIPTDTLQLPQQREKKTNLDVNLGCLVLLAPQRTMDTWWNEITRFCLLMRAIRSIDQNLNAYFGPYPIYVLVAKDWQLDPKQRDGEYTDADRALIQSWAPHSKVIFQEINLYSADALEPNTDRELILKWREGFDGSVSGRDLGYTSMCRLWSGRLQQMSFILQYKYYMRMDDDSLFISKVPEDPFLKMETNQLSYLWRRDASDRWGISQLWQICKPHITVTPDTPFLSGETYSGEQPYNNFHISSVAFWSSPEWTAIWNDLNEQHAFFKYRVGDANVHAIAVMLLEKHQFMKWKDIPYRHNSNDMGVKEWAPVEWRFECESAQAAHNVSWAKNHGGKIETL